MKLKINNFAAIILTLIWNSSLLSKNVQGIVQLLTKGKLMSPNHSWEITCHNQSLITLAISLKFCIKKGKYIYFIYILSRKLCSTSIGNYFQHTSTHSCFRYHFHWQNIWFWLNGTRYLHSLLAVSALVLFLCCKYGPSRDLTSSHIFGNFLLTGEGQLLFCFLQVFAK